MPKRWSKLKRDVEALFEDGLELTVHCTDMTRAIDSRVFNSGEHQSFQVLGNFRVVLGKEDLWSFPKDFIRANEPATWPDGRPYSYSASDINLVLRDYIDTPKAELLTKSFEGDLFGVSDLLKSADRRISVARVSDHFYQSTNTGVLAIIRARLSNKHRQQGRANRAPQPRALRM